MPEWDDDVVLTDADAAATAVSSAVPEVPVTDDQVEVTEDQGAIEEQFQNEHQEEPPLESKYPLERIIVPSHDHVWSFF